AYGRLSYSLASIEGLRLNAGVRWTRDEREMEWNSTALLTGACLLRDDDNALLNPCSRRASKDFPEVTYDVGVDDQISPETMVYLATRKGFRSGRFNVRAQTPLQSQPFESEIVKDVELGLKSSSTMFGMPARLNIAAYY